MDKLIDEMRNVKEVVAPEWAAFVKTGVSKERPPVNPEWWQVRAASVLSKVNKYGPIGTNTLAKAYGGKKNRGHRPEKKFDGSRNIVRKVLQQLESAGLIKQVALPKAGKVLTKKGNDLIIKTRD
ncbi:MAG: 40S ribosomal protein S19 [Candidatus Woesearchaeota archaeon]|jgi:small subunit ribosomal protein S19e|nr:40S ribosomal protein S19 [Candidatus Woesearchaeota archaeon]